MANPTAAYYLCPKCARKNPWKAELVGRRMKCVCGNIFKMPSVAANATKTPAPMPVVKRVEPDTPPLSHDISKSVMAGIPYRKGLQPEPAAQPSAMPSQIRDVVLPIVLIAAGFAAAAVDARHSTGNPGTTLANVAGPLILNLAVGMSLAVTAVLGGSAMAGIAFDGPMPQNILKLCAVALLPLPLGSMAGRAMGGINGDVVSALVGVGLYFAVFWAVFKMAWSDRVVCVMLIWIIRSGVAYAMFKLGGLLHGNQI
jgi:hypothetical protein